MSRPWRTQAVSNSQSNPKPSQCNCGRINRAARALSRLGVGEPTLDTGTRRVSLPVDAGTDRLASAARALEQADVVVDDIALRRPTLDEVFPALTGEHDDTDSIERTPA